MQNIKKITLKTHNFRNKYFILHLLILLIVFLPSDFILASENINKKQIINDVKSYIQNIQSVAINFEQSDSKGEKATGVLIINKPHKFRVNYFRPFPLIIVGNEKYVSIYDDEMGNLSRFPSKDNIFNFLLVDEVTFDDQFKIISVKQIKDLYKLKLKHLESEKISEVIFNKNTKNIEMMKIIEQNNIIELKFSIYKKITKVKDKLFILQDPDIFGKPKYLDQQKLENYYLLKTN